MIVWVGSPVGVGKTTLRDGVPTHCRASAVPTRSGWAGHLLMESMKDHQFADFHELPQEVRVQHG